MRISPVYYGWFVLGASAVSELLVQGATSYAASLFVLPLEAEFHISRANANSTILILFVGALLAAPWTGRLLDTRPIRLVVPAGAIVFGLSLASIAMLHSLVAMALILLIPTSIAFMCLGPLNTSTLASRWFHRRRGLALGIAAVATSGGSFTVVPLLNDAIQHYGWRQALFYEAVLIAAIIFVLALLVLRDRPSDMGLENHPENQGAESSAPALQSGPVPWKSVFTSAAFWIPSLTIATISGTCQAIVITLYPYSVQQGFTPTGAAMLISVFGIAAAATKVLAGTLADRINRRLLLVVAAAAMTLSWAILGLSAVYGAMVASAGLAGLALGCAMPTVASLIAESFGSGQFGRVAGWTFTLTGLMAILAVRFIGSVYDRLGSYHLAFETFAVILAGLLLINLLVSPVRSPLPA